MDRTKILQHDALKTKDEILASAFSTGDVCGVYFLIQDETINYIGKSVNVFARLKEHTMQVKIPFNKFACIAVPGNILWMYERSYIAVFKPKYNKNGKNLYTPEQMQELANKFPLSY